MYISRHLEKELIEASKGYPVIMVTGARQVGKTTMLKKLASKDRKFVSLDDLSARLMAQNQPKLFLEQYKPPLIIDEIQFEPVLLTYINILIDDSNENWQYWITCSQIYPMMKGVLESLAGRVRLLRLSGLSQSELVGRENEVFPSTAKDLLSRQTGESDRQGILHSILTGGYPRLLTQETVTIDGFYSSYLQTYLALDVREITNVMDTGKFMQFVSLLATRTAQELNLASLSRALGIDGTTAGRWLDVLETSGVIVRLPAYVNNLGKRIVKRPKIHFLDSGLTCYLCGIENEEAINKSVMKESLFESWVVSEVYKTWWNQGKQARLFYYRDSNQYEIDLLADRNGMLYPFEIKFNPQASHRFKNFHVLKAMDKPVGFAGLIHAANELAPLSEENWLIPARLI